MIIRRRVWAWLSSSLSDVGHGWLRGGSHVSWWLTGNVRGKSPSRWMAWCKRELLVTTVVTETRPVSSQITVDERMFSLHTGALLTSPICLVITTRHFEPRRILIRVLMILKNGPTYYFFYGLNRLRQIDAAGTNKSWWQPALRLEQQISWQ